MTNFLGWELFPSGGSTVGTLGPCILLNVPKVGHPNIYVHFFLDMSEKNLSLHFPQNNKFETGAQRRYSFDKDNF